MAASKNVKNFIPVVMYDVSETIPPANPADDVWTNEIGLTNNLGGIMNKKAVELAKQMGIDVSDYENNDDQTPAAKVVYPEERKIIAYYCKRNDVDVSLIDSLRDSDFIARGTELIARKQSPKFGIVKAEDITVVANLCAAVICDFCQITKDSFSTVTLNYNYNNVSETDAMAVFTIVKPIMSTIYKHIRAKSGKYDDNPNPAQSMVNESIEGDFTGPGLLRAIADRFGYKSVLTDESESDEADTVSRILKEEINKVLYKKGLKKKK